MNHPELGISESPLGDATLLPVLNLCELRHLDIWTRTLIDYNPTNTGFQFLQEAYQHGEWNGEDPRFKRSQEPYSHQSRKVRRQHRGADASTSCHVAEEELFRGDIGDDEVLETLKQHNATHGSFEHDKSLQVHDLQDESADTSENEFHLTHVAMPGDGYGNLTKSQIHLIPTESTWEQAVKTVEMIETGGGAYVEE